MSDAGTVGDASTLTEERFPSSPPAPDANADSADQVDENLRQAMILVDAALEVAGLINGRRRRDDRVVINPREAVYLLNVPQVILQDITSLAVRRTEMEKHAYLERSDIDWAWARLVVGKRGNPWVSIGNTVGGILLGAGIPILVTPLVTSTPVNLVGSLLGSALAVIGIGSLGVSMTMGFFRR